MKQHYWILLFFTFLFGNTGIYSQDIILKHDGGEIEAKVLEITTEEIRYKEFDFQEGPTRTINIFDVAMIIYESGRRESFQVADEHYYEYDPSSYKGNFFMIALGGGTSYGGLGMRIQFRSGGNVGFGMHGGAGYSLPRFSDSYEDETYIRFAAGFKLFVYRGFYLNYQLGVHDRLFITGTGMAGVDMSWGRIVGLGFNLAFGFTFIDNLHGTNRPLSPAFDLGLALRF